MKTYQQRKAQGFQWGRTAHQNKAARGVKETLRGVRTLLVGTQVWMPSRTVPGVVELSVQAVSTEKDLQGSGRWWHAPQPQQRQSCEFKTSLARRASFRTGSKATRRNPVSTKRFAGKLGCFRSTDLCQVDTVRAGRQGKGAPTHRLILRSEVLVGTALRISEWPSEQKSVTLGSMLGTQTLNKKGKGRNLSTRLALNSKNHLHLLPECWD